MKILLRRSIFAFLLGLALIFAASFLVKGQVQPLPEITSSGTTPAISHESTWETVNVKAVGDVMLARKVGRYMDAQGIDYPIQYVKDWLADADITMGNLESPLSTQGTPLPGKGIWFRGNPANVQALSDSGFDVLTVANNHAVDYDSPALLETIEVLESSGIAAIGGGENIQRARKPAIIETNGLKIAYLAYSEMADIYWDTSYKRTLKATDSVAGISPLYKENVLEDIAAVRDEVDVVILTLHWGIEYQHLPESYQSQMAKDFIDAGADVIIGHHPHCIQGVETYHGGLIFYSLGNFIFDQDWSLQTRQGLALELELTPLGWQQAVLSPVLITEGQPQLVEGEEGDAILQILTDISQTFGTDIELKDGKAYIKGAN